MEHADRIEITRADLDRAQHARAVLALLNSYAHDTNLTGKAAPAVVPPEVIEGLRDFPTSLVYLVFVEDEPAAVAVCFRSYSTFAARPLVNIHDFAVDPRFKRRGLGWKLLDAIEADARELGACRVTLEVQEENLPARRLYEKFGFAGAAGKGSPARTLFLEKHL